MNGVRSGRLNKKEKGRGERGSKQAGDPVLAFQRIINSDER